MLNIEPHTAPIASGSGLQHDSRLPIVPPPAPIHANTIIASPRRRRSYARPPRVRPWARTDVRPVLPLQLPPSSQTATLPPLPSAPRQPSFASQYILSTHLIPAAYPRTYPHAPAPPPPPKAGESPAARRQRVQDAVKEVVRTRMLYEAGALGAQGSTAPLWCALNRYVRRDLDATVKGKKGVTLFFAHASSFPKEIWEPIIHHLLTLYTNRPDAPPVDEIWSFEAVQHGDSALVNAGNLCGIWDAADGARDMIHFLQFYLPNSPTTAPLPVHLQRLPDAVADHRAQHGLVERTLVGIGHSLGGSCLTLAAFAQSALWRDSALVLIDPFICAPYTDAAPLIAAFVAGALARRDSWSSLAQARSTFQANPFFGAWDPAMLDIYLSCALYRPDPSKEEVCLKTSNVQEAILYESRIPFELWELVEALPTSVAVRWVMPAGRSIFGGDPAMAQSLVWRRPVNSSNVIIERAGHMIPQEQPRELAQDLFNYICERFGSTRARL